MDLQWLMPEAIAQVSDGTFTYPIFSFCELSGLARHAATPAVASRPFGIAAIRARELPRQL